MQGGLHVRIRSRAMYFYYYYFFCKKKNICTDSNNGIGIGHNIMYSLNRPWVGLSLVTCLAPADSTSRPCYDRANTE